MVLIWGANSATEHVYVRGQNVRNGGGGVHVTGMVTVQDKICFMHEK